MAVHGSAGVRRPGCTVHTVVAYLTDVRLGEDAPTEGYPWSLPAVRRVADLRLGDVTVLAGDNGTGKSTLVEALAVAAGFNAEGGSRNLRFRTHATHSDLSDHLRLGWRQRPRWGWFLRAETFYGMASHIAEDDDPMSGIAAMFPDLHARSHGESFLLLVEERMRSAGLYVLDEPESALSVHGQLRLLAMMHEAVAEGAQFVVATHSPLLMAYPGAVIHELHAGGMDVVAWEHVDAVALWRTVLDDPERVLRHLFAPED